MKLLIISLAISALSACGHERGTEENTTKDVSQATTSQPVEAPQPPPPMRPDSMLVANRDSAHGRPGLPPAPPGDPAHPKGGKEKPKPRPEPVPVDVMK